MHGTGRVKNVLFSVSFITDRAFHWNWLWSPNGLRWHEPILINKSFIELGRIN